MTILMERPALAGLMWKTDWVPDWISIYTSSQQLIYHEPKPAFSHLCVRLLCIVKTFLFVPFLLHSMPTSFDYRKLGSVQSVGRGVLNPMCFWVTGGWDKSSRDSKPNLWAPSCPDSYNCTRASNYLSLFVYFGLHCHSNEISWCASVSVCHAYLWTIHMIGCNAC